MKTGKVDLGIDSGNSRNIGSGVTKDSSIALCCENRVHIFLYYEINYSRFVQGFGALE